MLIVFDSNFEIFAWMGLSVEHLPIIVNGTKDPFDTISKRGSVFRIWISAEHAINV